MVDTYAILLISCMAVVTALIRILPFIIFNGRETPKPISYLGKYLPYSIIGMLIIYCIKDVSLVKVPHAIPEIISILLVVVLHIYKRNTLLSIIAGTLCYMLTIHIF